MADDIAHWLEGLVLGQYAQAFEENYIDWEVLTELTDADLEKIDVPLGHRKKLLRRSLNCKRRVPPQRRLFPKVLQLVLPSKPSAASSR